MRALGIAGTQTSGLAEWRVDGSWIKRLHPGRAAQSGVLAARLAQEGFTGPASILEGATGFLQAFAFEGTIDAETITRRLGKEFRSMATAFKPYPCCRFSHGALDLALGLHRDGVEASHVTSVQVRTDKTDILGYARAPRSTVDAQFCLPYLVAAALARGRVGLSELRDEAIRDPRILAIAERVTAVVHSGDVRARDGRRVVEISAELAARLAVSEGALVELLNPAGAPLRAWTLVASDVEGDRCRLSPDAFGILGRRPGERVEIRSAG